MNVACLAFVLANELGVSAGIGYLTSPDLKGSAFALGARWRAAEHIALGFDAGYGVIGKIPDVQDRWWLMPSVALVMPSGSTALDVGAGLGLGATSGYRSWSEYVAGPFNPVWALQLVPTFRVHLQATRKLTKRLDGFLRLDLASLLLRGNSIGSRVGIPDPAVADTRWLDLLIGIQFRAL